MKNIFLEKIEQGDFRHFSGMDIPMDIPIAQSLLNEQLSELTSEAMPELELSLHDNNILYLSLAARAPFAGLVRRRIKAKMEGGIDAAGAAQLTFYFLDGLKLLDKQLINFFSKKIAELLPNGVQLSKDGCTADLRILMAAAGYGYLLPVVRRLQLSTETGRLRLKMHLKA